MTVGCIMKVLEYLDASSTKYEIKRHRPVFTAQHIAQQEHVHGMNVAKPVVVKADGVFYMCVLPACCKIDFDALKSVLEADEVILADEREMERLFPDCQLGAEPPFGSLYGMPTIMDDRLECDEYIVFQDGSHDEALKIDLHDYLEIECPRIFSFSYHIR